MTIVSERKEHYIRHAEKANMIDGLWNPRPKTGLSVKHDPDVQKRVCQLYKEGYSLRILGVWFMTSYETIRAILETEGVLRRPKTRSVEKAKIGKESIVGGYVKIFMGVGFPGANRSGWMMKHRLIMQKQLDRLLNPWEVVHHIDRNKLNNEISNLSVVSATDHPTCLHCPYYKFYKDSGGVTELDNLGKV